MKRMTKWERIEAALHGDDVDRVPISLWKHYHLQDRSPRQLAHATLALYHQFDIDLIKLTPSGLTPIQDWGASIRFGVDDDTAPSAVQSVITSPGQWAKLPHLDVGKGALGRELETIHHVAADLAGEAPFIMSVFSPLTVAFKLCGDRVSGASVFEHLRQSPRQLHAGLRIIADVVRDYSLASLQAGASGIFFATQLANHDALTVAEYKEFGVPYDREVLEALQGTSRVTMLHICRKNILFDLLADYPVNVINWADRESGVSLAAARKLTKKTLAGGLSLETLLSGSEADVRAQVHDAIAQAGRTGFILAPACVVKGLSPDANLAAARRAVEETATA